MIDRNALHDVLAEHVHAEPPLGCPILGALAVGADALAIGATTASLDAAPRRRASPPSAPRTRQRQLRASVFVLRRGRGVSAHARCLSWILATSLLVGLALTADSEGL